MAQNSVFQAQGVSLPKCYQPPLISINKVIITLFSHEIGIIQCVLHKVYGVVMNKRYSM